jgi:hypothetical protein
MVDALACRRITEAYRRAAHGEGVEEVCVESKRVDAVLGRPHSHVLKLHTFFCGSNSSLSSFLASR